MSKFRSIHKSDNLSIVFIEIILGIAFSIASLVIFAIVSKDVLQQQTLLFDESVSRAIYALRTPSLTQTMIFISLLGADILVFITGVVTILLAWKKHTHEAILFLTVLAIGLFINVLLKAIFQRPRPEFDPILDLSSSYSFPSGHAMNAFIFYTVVSYFVYHFTHNKVLSIFVTIFSLVLILLIGFSRVYLGVHFPSDVIAGYIAGFFVFVTAIVLEKTIAFRTMTQKVKNKKFKLSK